MESIPDLPWLRVADAVADGLRIVAGDRVSVFLTDAGSFPVVRAFCEKVYERGGIPHVVLADEHLDSLALRFASVPVLATKPALEEASLLGADVHVSFRGMLPPEPRPAGMGDAELAARVAAQRAGKGLISSLRWGLDRWAIVRVPTAEWAEYIGIDATTLFDEFFAGCLMDWDSVRPEWEGLARRLEAARTVRLVSHDTDLSLSVAGRRTVVFAGEANWPDGELATAPVETDVDGHISFPERFYFAGECIEGLALEFEAGLVREVRAKRGQDVARALLDTDSGSRRVGELGIGLNGGMRTMTGDLLFDEKILGTAHIALGRAYPQCGGVNSSSLHWDIVKDLRGVSGGGPGDILLDGEPLLLAGEAAW